MASTLKIKRSAVASKAPATTDLVLGELAINTYDGKLYLKKNAGADVIVEVGPVLSVMGLVGDVPAATAADYRDNVPGGVLTPDGVWSAMAEVALVDGAAITVDYSAGFDFFVTLAGNRTLYRTLAAGVFGKKGRIRVMQDAVGGRTLSFGVAYEFAGGVAPALSPAPNAEDVFYYDIITTERILLLPVQDIK